jgi:hypothetical protein
MYECQSYKHKDKKILATHYYLWYSLIFDSQEYFYVCDECFIMCESQREKTDLTAHGGPVDIIEYGKLE